MTCTECVGEQKECEICGDGPKMITWSMADGLEPMYEFVNWIMGFKNYETVAFAHYGGRFDSHFVLRELTNRGVLTELMMGELKIYQIKAGKVYFRDFWLLSQNRLADLPKTLELNIPAKLYFPYRYNKNENFGKRLSHLPPFEAYCPGGMKEVEFEKFEKWYTANYETAFELSAQLKAYCENDVEILMAAVLKFRKLFLGITKDMDVLKDSVTIASIVMKIFRAKFLKERHIPIVPEGGFEKSENQSKIAVKYFEWLAYRDGVKVRHACNGGEIEFGRFKVDCVIGSQKKIVEFQGCAWHGCRRCFLPWTVGPNGLCAEQNFRRTEMRMDHLSEICGKLSVEEVWECDVKEELKKNREMKKFFDSVPDKGPINPRDAYAGGRTMPFCLFAEVSESVEISMFDIVSLYPFVNYDTPYPVGIPKIIKNANYNVLWARPDDVPYDGLLKVKVIPPKKLLYPLLSVHIDDMLLFPNCGICARRAKKEFVLAKDVKRTTSAARVKLYEYMEKVYSAEGCKLLYCDTDSLIFTHPRGVCPLKEGNFLGEMTREYGDSDILEFVAAGPKQYSLKLKKKANGGIWHNTKIRGITLNMDNEFGYEEFKKMVLGFKEGAKKQFRYPEKIGPTKDSRVLSKDTSKDYGPVQRKGIIDADWNVLPYGFY
uniref:DNA-directed DNA polymerase n=2 Tax=Globodera rostochiensis TaxID=31243 RepID=A0A914IFF8_GLORO